MAQQERYTVEVYLHKNIKLPFLFSKSKEPAIDYDLSFNYNLRELNEFLEEATEDISIKALRIIDRITGNILIRDSDISNRLWRS